MVALTAEALFVEPDKRLAEIDDLIIVCRHELSALKDRLEFKEQELEQRKRSRPEFAYFYKFIPPGVVDPSFREVAEKAFEIAAEELDLTDLPLKIRWFDNLADQDRLRQGFRSGDMEIFSHVQGLRGFISWVSVMETGHVNLASEWHNSPAARVTAHELRHVWQRRQYGSNEVPTARNGEREFDADNYGADFWDRHKAKFRPWLAEDSGRARRAD
jgi:hypothetical protein